MKFSTYEMFALLFSPIFMKKKHRNTLEFCLLYNFLVDMVLAQMSMIASRTMH